jgi:hypothetical protein
MVVSSTLALSNATKSKVLILGASAFVKAQLMELLTELGPFSGSD